MRQAAGPIFSRPPPRRKAPEESGIRPAKISSEMASDVSARIAHSAMRAVTPAGRSVVMVGAELKSIGQRQFMHCVPHSVAKERQQPRFASEKGKRPTQRRFIF